MLKDPKSMKELEHHAEQELLALLQQVPTITLVDIETEASNRDQGVDVVAHIEVGGKPHTLVCEVKSTGQPRHVRTALLQLRNYAAHHERSIPVFVAPYLSPESQALCREGGVGFLDLEGNVRIVFDGIFIERQVANKPSAERRDLKSIFKPKSAQVLRVMLRDPSRPWRVTDLAAAADVSVGHVSNVRTALLDREWGKVSDEGLYLLKPNSLVEEWRTAYEPPSATSLPFYTTLHGSELEKAARGLLRAEGTTGLAMLASFSAANWLAPYGRIGTQYFYTDKRGLETLKVGLKLQSSAKGENVVVNVLKDPGLFRDAFEPAAGVFCTSPVQTYLDLAHAGERGREAAEHLKEEKLLWLK